MGNNWYKLGKTKEEVEEDLNKVTSITNNDLFFKKTSYLLQFKLTHNMLKNLFSHNVIECSIVR
jgi:hypothetical protein